MSKSFWNGISVAVVMLFPSIANAQDCTTLRQACLMKNPLGEVGQGNCQRYRERCGGGRGEGGTRNRCAQLRSACMFKEQRGEQGQGNCQRYREECGGR